MPFLPPPGIVSDETTFATPGRWADCNWTRFWLGKPQSIPGWTSAFIGTLSGVCRNVLVWQDNDGVENIAFGTHTHLMVLKNGTLSDITPSGLTAGSIDGAGGPGYGSGGYGDGGYGEALIDAWFPRTWSLANFGELLLASPRAGTVYAWANDPGADATEVTQAPDNINYMLVLPSRQVMAFGCNEEVSTDFNALCIRWTDTEDYTDWTTASDNLAGEYLLEGGGRIVAARLMGDSVAVWTNHALYVGENFGTDGWIFRRIASNCGLVGPNAVQIINQQAYWITPDLQVFTWALGIQPALVPCPIRTDFKDNVAVGQAEKIAATSISQYGEIWWMYPDGRDGVENSRYIAVSTLDGSWFRGQIERSACIDAGPTQYPLMITPDGYGYWHENGYTADGASLSGYITSSDVYLDEAQRHAMIRGVWPDFEDQQGGISLTLTFKKYPQATGVAKGPYLLTVGQGKKDFLCSGRIMSQHYEWGSSPARNRFGKPAFDVVPTGEE
jgi:hypothetical protein